MHTLHAHWYITSMPRELFLADKFINIAGCYVLCAFRSSPVGVTAVCLAVWRRRRTGAEVYLRGSAEKGQLTLTSRSHAILSTLVICAGVDRNMRSGTTCWGRKSGNTNPDRETDCQHLEFSRPVDTDDEPSGRRSILRYFKRSIPIPCGADI